MSRLNLPFSARPVKVGNHCLVKSDGPRLYMLPFPRAEFLKGPSTFVVIFFIVTVRIGVDHTPPKRLGPIIVPHFVNKPVPHPHEGGTVHDSGAPNTHRDQEVPRKPHDPRPIGWRAYTG